MIRKIRFIKRELLRGILVALLLVILAVLSAFLFIWGYYLGFDNGVRKTSLSYEEALQQIVSSKEVPLPPSKTNSPSSPQITWGGKELWEAVNKRRQELGVNSLSTASEICTLASIRLNELLDLGTLDGHEGFSRLAEEREDLKWIFEKYNLSEFLVAGATSAEKAVSLWENTLGHSKLLTGGEYVWGCTYAQEGFGVAITGY